ncbi:MAG TPA: O-antigen ligase family protein [Gammaproteobacteria bacterium]|nr:O-antigen ligase family protein [Gammaproteobacteria bacterium]
MNSTNDIPVKEAESPSYEPPHWAGKPLRNTLLFLTLPALLIGIPLAFNIQLPKPVLYGVAAALGITLLVRSFKDPEWLMAAFILYMPLSKMVVVPLAPGLNGTNMLLLMAIISWVAVSTREERPFFRKLPASKLVLWYGLVSSISAITVILSPLGLSYLLAVGSQFKAWIDQFLVFFIFLNLIRDGVVARRIVVYMMMGMVLTSFLGVIEMLDKQGLATIEKSRVLGPQLQPNDHGAFLVYSLAPFIGIFLANFWRLRIWVLMPYFLIVAKLIISTFSRGAWLGLAAGAFGAGLTRGIRFSIAMGMLGIAAIIVMPQLIPESIMARIAHTTGQPGQIEVEELDRSSENRLILWKAAIDMTLEDPILGKGFKAFRRLKARYTEYDVMEADTHNMYLWVASQMGIPALILFVAVIARMFFLGWSMRSDPDRFIRAMAIAAAAMSGGVAAINMFGSRMTNIEVDGYFWVFLAVLAHLKVESRERPAHQQVSTAEDPPPAKHPVWDRQW